MGYHGNPLRQMIPQNITCLRKIPSVLLGGFPKFDLIALDRTLNPHSRTSWDLERTEGTSTFASFMQWYLQGVHNTKRWGWTKPTKKTDFIKIIQDISGWHNLNFNNFTVLSFPPFPPPQKNRGERERPQPRKWLCFSPRSQAHSTVSCGLAGAFRGDTGASDMCFLVTGCGGLYGESRFFVQVDSVVSL